MAARGRPKKVVFQHRLHLSEDLGRDSRVMSLIQNLERMRAEYGDLCIDSMILRTLIGLSYQEMVSWATSTGQRTTPHQPGLEKLHVGGGIPVTELPAPDDEEEDVFGRVGLPEDG